jgi:hypothetical protein
VFLNFDTVCDASVKVDLQIGDNIGSVSGALTEKPKGSNRWVL